MKTRRDLLLFLPRLFSRRSTYRFMLVLPILFAIALAAFVAVALFMCMVAGFMGLVAVGIVLSPLLLLAAIVIGPKPVGRWLDRVADWAVDTIDRASEVMFEWAERRFDSGDKFMAWAFRPKA